MTGRYQLWAVANRQKTFTLFGFHPIVRRIGGSDPKLPVDCPFSDVRFAPHVGHADAHPEADRDPFSAIAAPSAAG